MLLTLNEIKSIIIKQVAVDDLRSLVAWLMYEMLTIEEAQSVIAEYLVFDKK
jgi:hypothetical protein